MTDNVNIEEKLATLDNMGNESGLDQISSEITENGDIEVEGDGFFITGFATDIMEEKDMVRFIKQTERLIRKSTEYSDYIGFLHGDLNISRCSILGHITSEMASIEMHHYPFTLYDITHTVVNNFINNDVPLTTFDVADTVMRIHYENKVGLVPLSVTAHELAHSGEIFVNLKQVFGNLKAFINEFKNDISGELRAKFMELVKRSKDDEAPMKRTVLVNDFTTPDEITTITKDAIEQHKVEKAREVTQSSAEVDSDVNSLLDNFE